MRTLQPRSTTTVGLGVALLAALTFGTSAALVKPLLEAGWSPAAAVTVRVLIGAVVLSPVAVFLMRGRWSAMWRARNRVLMMALVGVAGSQLTYFAAVQRIPIGTAILIEYMAPLLLVIFVWARSRRVPRAVVLIGSGLALVGLVLVVSPSGAGSLDALGIIFAMLAAIACAVYYVVAAQPSDGVPPVALAAAGLVIGGLALGLLGVLRVLPFTATFTDVDLLGTPAPWWVPLLIIGVVATALAYAASITATVMLGSRLASFAGLLEVVAAAFYAWLLLGEHLSLLQLLGGALILLGIGFVRSERVETLAAGLDEEPFAEHPLAEPVLNEAVLAEPVLTELVLIEPVLNEHSLAVADVQPMFELLALNDLPLHGLEDAASVSDYDEDRTGPIAVHPA